MANALRGEAELDIGGQKHTICINMGALARISEACDAPTFARLQEAAFEFPNMPKIVRACLDASGIKGVTDEQIAEMDWPQYVERLIPALFRTKPKDDAETDPPKGQRKK